MKKKNLVIFTGAGISEESGLKTFRDSGGLWENYRIEDVATPEAWERNPALVTEFYNMRRKQIMEALPNRAHEVCVELENYFNVQIITQNIDDLHERAGSKNVLHLHGEIMYARSSGDENLLYKLNHWEIKIGDKCEKGYQLRPHVVWFGEMVPMMEPAILKASHADLFVVVGSSLQVYPAASLIHYVPEEAEKWLVDPGNFNLSHIQKLRHIRKKASEGMEILKSELIQKHL
ncbi:MAG: NAD-dependent deacylase [Bacteroidia bacterium]|nr:NAD-dependent deacylase [Bacteroidia bacterium]